MLDSKRAQVLNYTSEEQDEIRNLRPSEWTRIMKEISIKEMEQIQYEHSKEEKKIRGDLEFRESIIEKKKEELKHLHEDRLEEIEAGAEKRIEDLKDSTRKKQQDHAVEMKKYEEAHKLKIRRKKKELLDLNKKSGEIKDKYKEAFEKQEDFIQKREQELDSDFSKKWDEQQVKLEKNALWISKPSSSRSSYSLKRRWKKNVLLSTSSLTAK